MYRGGRWGVGALVGGLGVRRGRGPHGREVARVAQVEGAAQRGALQRRAQLAVALRVCTAAGVSGGGGARPGPAPTDGGTPRKTSRYHRLHYFDLSKCLYKDTTI